MLNELKSIIKEAQLNKYPESVLDYDLKKWIQQLDNEISSEYEERYSHDYDDRYDEGHDEGYDEGYDECSDRMEEDIASFIEALIDEIEDEDASFNNTHRACSDKAITYLCKVLEHLESEYCGRTSKCILERVKK